MCLALKQGCGALGVGAMTYCGVGRGKRQWLATALAPAARSLAAPPLAANDAVMSGMRLVAEAER